jgi:hypothetical protein
MGVNWTATDLSGNGTRERSRPGVIKVLILRLVDLSFTRPIKINLLIFAES